MFDTSTDPGQGLTTPQLQAFALFLCASAWRLSGRCVRPPESCIKITHDPADVHIWLAWSKQLPSQSLENDFYFRSPSEIFSRLIFVKLLKQTMRTITHFRYAEAVGRWQDHQNHFDRNMEPNLNSKVFKCDTPGHHLCRLTRFNLRNALCRAPSSPDTPVRTDNVIENFFCWNVNLPAPGATKPRALHDLAGNYEHAPNSLMDDAWPRLVEVVEYPCKSSEADKDDKKPKSSLRSRYFVERSVVNGYDQFVEIDWKKENSGIKSLSLQVCIVLVCEARGGKQWEVNVLG